MLVHKMMKPQDRSKWAAICEATAWVIGFSVLLGVFLPNFRHVTPTILLPLGIVFGTFAIWWLGSKPNRAKSPLPAFETSPSFNLHESGHLPTREPSIFGQPFHAVHFVPEPTLSEKLRGLGGAQFVQIIELIFQDRGFRVSEAEETNARSDGDEGFDLIIESTTEKYAVQSRNWRKWNVDTRQMKDFLDSMTAARMQKGVFVALAGCSHEAKQLAGKNGIQIVDEADIIEMLVESGLMYDHRISELLSDEMVHVSK